MQHFVELLFGYLGKAILIEDELVQPLNHAYCYFVSKLFELSRATHVDLIDQTTQCFLREPLHSDTLALDELSSHRESRMVGSRFCLLVGLLCFHVGVQRISLASNDLCV